MIFTPRDCFDHSTVQQVRVLSGYVHNGELVQARLQVVTNTPHGVSVFYGDEAASVLSQLQEAGYYTAEQQGKALAAL